MTDLFFRKRKGRCQGKVAKRAFAEFGNEIVGARPKKRSQSVDSRVGQIAHRPCQDQHESERNSMYHHQALIIASQSFVFEGPKSLRNFFNFKVRKMGSSCAEKFYFLSFQHDTRKVKKTENNRILGWTR